VAFVTVSHPGLPEDVVSTTDFIYVRFHGKSRQLYRYHYADKELDVWAKRLAGYLTGRRLYAFFNNDYEANAPRNALRLREMLLGAALRG
jgi:uncharacterized protein YecE (DUF72 family)